MNFEIARTRSAINEAVRRFFIQRGYLEVETPLLTPSLIPEAPIEVFETMLQSRSRGGSRPCYLIPSPEVHMKKLIASGSGDIFQICRSFRNLEESGRHHNPEFTMLEWYTVGADYLQSIPVTEELFGTLAEQFGRPGLQPPFLRLSVAEAFREYTGIDLERMLTVRDLQAECSRRGLLQVSAGSHSSWEELYHRVFLSHVEPRLPSDKPLILYDYPRNIPCLARDIPGTPWKERWELYVNGIEIANCYSEETNPIRIEDFFRAENARKVQAGAVVPEPDQEFIDIFRQGYPKSSGVALGVDRLVMLLTGQESIGGVIFFPISDMV